MKKNRIFTKYKLSSTIVHASHHLILVLSVPITGVFFPQHKYPRRNPPPPTHTLSMHVQNLNKSTWKQNAMNHTCIHQVHSNHLRLCESRNSIIMQHTKISCTKIPTNLKTIQSPTIWKLKMKVRHPVYKSTKSTHSTC